MIPAVRENSLIAGTEHSASSLFLRKALPPLRYNSLSNKAAAQSHVEPQSHGQCQRDYLTGQLYQQITKDILLRVKLASFFMMNRD